MRTRTAMPIVVGLIIIAYWFSASLLASKAWPFGSASPVRSSLADATMLPAQGGSWTELTSLPYDLEDPRYRAPESDQFFAGSGVGFSAGRVQALAVDGDTVYAGAATGGVWRSVDRGRHWTPVSDGLASLSSGDLAIDPANGDVWYGTGEAAPGFHSYRGVGVFRSTDAGESWELIGGTQLDQTLIGDIELDGAGNVYAATSRGLFRRSTSDPAADPWTLVLRPGTPGPFGFTFVNDVVVRPGTYGKVVVAALGWRETEVDYNGLYVSRDHGLEGTWERIDTRGDVETKRISRASLAYSSDGTRLYSLVESWRPYAERAETNLYGVFLVRNGNPGGRWIKIAGSRTLRNSKGSFTAINPGLSGLPGSQANYNQAIGVDPGDPDHLYVGLEELYETTDAGESWITAAPGYCGVGKLNLPTAFLNLCRNTTHGDHHALAFGDGVVYSGNDGGVYRRPLRRHTVGGWVNLNRTLHALQYYAAGVGSSGTGDTIWGVTHDNGVSLLRPGASTMVAPHCCEGFSLIVDPSDPQRAAIVHVDFLVTITTNGGLAHGFRGAGPPESPPTWTYPLRADPLHPNRHWVLGSAHVWESRRGWRTTKSDWVQVDDPGDDHMLSAVDVYGDTIYAAWCGPTLGRQPCDPDPDFASGIDTNVGGAWHHVVGPGIVDGGDPLPNRFINSIRLDPSDPLHVYAIYGEYRRPWTAAPRSGGHVFESTDGGESWSDISGNLPAAAATDILILSEKLVVSTEVGVFVAETGNPTTWSKLGTGIPNVAVNSLTLTPDGSSIVAATYGRGLWSIEKP